MDDGKVGLGRTFYRLDGGTVTAAGKNLFVTTAGAHQLEFWSMDQSGNVEAAPNHAFFTIGVDAVPPTTTSNAQGSYNQSTVITLTAIDASTLGVKNTYYQLNGGPIQAGTKVIIPATNASYTLLFWSEDWAGNVETPNSVNFTVTVSLGSGTLSLVWGDSDGSGSPCAGDPDAEARWRVIRGTTVVATGSGACPNWSGVDNLTAPVSSTGYTVLIDWWDSYYEDWDQTRFQNVRVTTPGQVIRLSY
jgi:hypothetical protein